MFSYMFVFALVFALFPAGSDAVRCHDCVGDDCMARTCTGDYCVLTQYAPRWGVRSWGQPRVVKGCMSGTMVRKDIRDHCETVDGEGAFTCFCDSDYCNGHVNDLDEDPVELVECLCRGKHCRGDTCMGELCTYVQNLVTGEKEQGCINASVPIVERRSIGACMVPPITGAMHHTLAQSAEDLLVTESCVCGTSMCNKRKPTPRVPENMKCSAFVQFELLGTKTASRNISCDGEYCFKSEINSKIGQMSKYKTMGCASFIDDAELPEEFDPIGCAKFDSEYVSVQSCFTTDDKKALSRARANQERPPKKNSPRGKGSRKPDPREYEDEEDDYVEEEEKEPPRRKGARPGSKKKPSKVKQRVEEEEDEFEEEEPREESKEEEKEAEEEAPREREEAKEKEEPKQKADKAKETFVFQTATQPPIPDDSNVTLVAIFVLLMLLIVASGAVWKFELHKKLFRSSYDTVAGG